MQTKPNFFLLFFALVTTVLQAKDHGHLPTQNRSVSFTENKGQFADQNYQARHDVLFGGSDGEIAFYIRKNGISYQQYRVDAAKEIEDPKTKQKRNEIVQQTIYRTDITWVNANENPQVVAGDAMPGFSNYYLQQCERGALDVKSYNSVVLQNIYKNINVHYYESGGKLKCDYIVSPHTDYKQIQLNIQGANIALMDDGSLLIETPLGKIKEEAPIVYQNGKRLAAHYKINGNVIGFEVEDYNSKYELIIDPVTRLWGTYYGGTGADLCTSTKVDASGNVFVAGHSGSNSGTVIATTGSHQNTFGGGGFDAFLVKFNSAGNRIWATYYGGSGSDFATDCALDPSGNVFMTGYTSSNVGTVIATAGSHQSSYAGGNYDAYLVQFNTNGVRLWGTYYGGSGIDVGNSCSVDPSGNVYLAGYSSSNTGTAIATASSHQSAYGGGTYDAFLVKFSNAGVRSWATYYGGTANDVAYACSYDASGNIYMSGHSASTGGTVIATAGSHQSSNNGADDGFLVKFNSNGVRQWATYYGGSSNENVFGCSTDASGNVFIAGHSASIGGTAIATPGSHQSTSGGGWDMFVVKFNSSGIRSWGTYYGDTGSDCCWFSTSDASGNVYLVGYADNSSGNAIATPGSHQTTYGGGLYDICLVKFRNNGVRVWGTYYGGTGDDSGSSCATDGAGNLYLLGGGNTTTGTVIATPGSYQPVIGGSSDSYLVKFEDCNLYSASVNGPVCAAGTLSLAVDNFGTLNPGYSWIGPNLFTSSVQNPTIGGISTANIGVYTVTLNYGNCVQSETVQVNTILPQPTVTVNSGTICSGNNFIIVPAGASTYTITGGAFTVSPTGTTTYSVIGTNSAGCVSGAALSTVTVSMCTGIREYQSNENAKLAFIYPNPSSGHLTIESTKEAHVKVIDLQGRVISDFKVLEGVNAVSIDHLDKGMYILEIEHVKEKQVLRIIRQ